MTVNEKIRKGVEQTGKLPVAGEAPVLVLRVVSNIADDLKVMRDCVRIVSELGVRRTSQIAALRADTVLRPTVVQERIVECDRAHEREIDQHMQKIAELIQWAANHTPLYTRRAALMRASFDKEPAVDAQIRTSHLLRLGKLATGGLLEVARLAAARKDAALAGLVVDELEDRERFNQGNARHVAREERHTITALLNSVPTEAEEVTPMLDEMQTLAREAIVASGHAKSVDKIALGLLKQQQGGTADDDAAAAAQA